MPITFHCDHCGKKIEAQDGAGGKWGKCPACNNRIYIPDFTADEDLKLAPVDTSEEAKRRQLMAETYRITQDILQEREIPDDHTGPAVSTPQTSDEELTGTIVAYLRQMADGELNEARETADLIIPFGGRAVEILDRIAVSEMPEPELAGIPSQVLAGLIRQLRARIGR
ncbi:MAG: TFIIB-type zinc ribbon-containing protein [Planctomycetota bacterium]